MGSATFRTKGKLGNGGVFSVGANIGSAVTVVISAVIMALTVDFRMCQRLEQVPTFH